MPRVLGGTGDARSLHSGISNPSGSLPTDFNTLSSGSRAQSQTVSVLSLPLQLSATLLF